MTMDRWWRGALVALALCMMWPHAVRCQESAAGMEPTTDTDEYTSPNDRPLSEEEAAALAGYLDAHLAVEEHRLTDEEQKEIDEELGHEVLVEDKELYDRLFERYTSEVLKLAPDEETYAYHLWAALTHTYEKPLFGRGGFVWRPAARPHSKELRNLCRLYVHLLAQSGMSFEDPRNRPQFPLDALVQRFESPHYDGLQFAMFFRRIPTNLGRWASYLVLGRPATFATEVAASLALWANNRGISEDDLLLLWMIEKYPQVFEEEHLNEALHESLPHWKESAHAFARFKFGAKTTPSLRYNNEVALSNARYKPTWEELGNSNIGPANWIARAMYENPAAANWPVWGTIWRGFNSLADAIEGRTVDGKPVNRLAASLSFAVSMALVTADLYLAGTGVRLIYQAGKAAASATVAGARGAYFRTLQAAVHRFGSEATRTQLYRNLMARELKRMRNVLPRSSAQAMQWAQQARQLARKAMGEARSAGDKARAVTGIVSTKTGRSYVGISADGVSRTVSEHPRLTRIREWLRSFPGGKRTQKGSLESWPFENCAEWEAVNNALKAGEKMEDLVIYTARNKSGLPITCCLNCRFTTFGAWVPSRRHGILPKDKIPRILRD